MNSNHTYASLAWSASLLLTVLGTSAAARADIRIELTAVANLPELREGNKVLNEIRALAARPPLDDWERDILGAGATSFEKVLTKPLGALVGVGVVSDAGANDALIVQWQPGGSAADGVRGLSVLDTPDYSWFVVKCDPASFKSSDSTQDFLKHLLKWRYPAPDPLVVGLRYSPTPGETFLSGGARTSMEHLGLDYDLSGIRRNSDAYLILKLGKAWFANVYPEGGIYVPERFPPLKQLAKQWSKERILSETQRTWLATGPSTYHGDRDSILISEFASRGLTGYDLQALLLAPNPPAPVARELRVGAVMRALISTNQLERNRAALEDATLRMGSLEDSPLAVHRVFEELARVDSDYTGLATQCLDTCLDQEAPLRYLLAKGSSEEVYAKVERAAIPERLVALQRRVLGQIRARIESPNKSH